MRPGNIAMFHIGRCGSTVLTSLLKQHSKVFWASELYEPIFKEWRRKTQENVITGEMPDDAILILQKSMKKAFHRYYGFEIKPFHFRLIDYSKESYIEHLDRLGFSHFIILDRENRLRKIISSMIAHEDRTRFHMKGKTKSKLKQIYIDVDKVTIDYDQKPLLSFLEDYENEMSSLKEILEKKNCLCLTYEKDVQDDPRLGYRKICDFLNIKPKDVTIDLSRTNPFQVREMIENFQNVNDMLKDTKYEWMLYG